MLISLSGVDDDLKRAFEPNSPGIRRRLQMMAQLAERGLRAGRDPGAIREATGLSGLKHLPGVGAAIAELIGQ